jgi:hypothetical protein
LKLFNFCVVRPNFDVLCKQAFKYPKSGNVRKLDSPSGPDLRIDEREVGLGQLHERVHGGDARAQVPAADEQEPDDQADEYDGDDARHVLRVPLVLDGLGSILLIRFGPNLLTIPKFKLVNITYIALVLLKICLKYSLLIVNVLGWKFSKNLRT